jgi:hypothetical protein
MPLVPTALQGLMTPLASAGSIAGMYSPQLILGLSNGITAYLLTLQVKTTDVGTLGVGIGTGKVIITPPQLVGPLMGAASSNSLTGTYVAGLMSAIGTATASFIVSAGMVTSQHPTVAIGSGIGQFIPTGPSPLQGQLMGMLSASGFTGQYLVSLATAVAQGITQGLGTAQIIQVITGTPITPPPLPGSGVGIGKLI